MSLFFFFHSEAQVHKLPADTAFYYTYGGVNNDEARDVVEAYDKGYLLVGTTSSFGQGNTSFYIVKTDSLGNHKWSNTQGGAENDWAYSVQRTMDSCYLVVGYSNSFSTSSMHNYSAYYLKIDRNGNLLWQKSIDKGAWSFAYGSCAMPDSGFVLCGQTYATAQGNADAYLIRINKNGDTLWTRQYGGNKDDVFNSICVMHNRLYAVGANASYPADGIADAWLAKIDFNGNLLQQNFVAYTGPLQETINAITPYNDSLFTIGGSAFHPDSNTTVGIIAKYDTSLAVNSVIESGDLIVSKGYYESYYKVLNTSYGSICLVGTKNGGLGGTGTFLVGFNQYNGFIPDFAFAAGGVQNDYGYSGLYTSKGKIIAVGSTYSYGAGSDDVFLVRLNSDSIKNTAINTFIINSYTDTLSLSQASIRNYAPNVAVSIYPNPSTGSIHLFIKNTLAPFFTMKLYSVLGEELSFQRVYSNADNLLDFSFLNAGNYFVTIEQNDRVVSSLHIIISKE
ncbi:MAG: T9SS type A sorting domain-containing protein [Bacteroidetes bacterium]|nr:T9SS type A sorting domain-containing protein [Bacteroidota bacterium]